MECIFSKRFYLFLHISPLRDLSVCLSVSHICSLCLNFLTNSFLWGPVTQCVRWGPWPSGARRDFGAERFGKARKGSFINDVMHWGQGEVHDIVTMCDEGEGGERFCDFTHIASAATPGQGIVDHSASILYRTPWCSTHGASDREWCKPIATGVPTHGPRHRRPCPIPVANVSNNIENWSCVWNSWSIGFTRLSRGVEVCEVIFEGKSRTAWRNVTNGEKGGYFFLKIVWHHLRTTPNCFWLVKTDSPGVSINHWFHFLPSYFGSCLDLSHSHKFTVGVCIRCN